MSSLQGRTIAILATDGVEEIELTEPLKALKAAGAETTLVSLEAGTIQAMKEDVNAAGRYEVALAVTDAKAEAFDGLLLPGGTTNPDKLRLDDKAVAFVKGFIDSGKPIAAICHGPWTLIEAGGVKGHTMTSWPSLKTDLTNAGAMWVDRTVVTDGNLVTSRNPKDLPAFCDAMVDLFSKAA